VSVARQFGKNLVRYRKAAGVSQETLGSLAGLHRTEVGILEKGLRHPRIDTLVKLAGSLEVTPGELLDGISWRPPPFRSGSFAGESEPEP
jgi:transcriptional regulator with XRE-family HTH domain